MSPSTDKVYSLLKPCLLVVWSIEPHPWRVLCQVHGKVRFRQPKEKTYQFYAMLIQYICHSFKFHVISNRHTYLCTGSGRTLSRKDVAAEQGFLFSLKIPALGAGKSGLVVVR